MFKKSRKEDMDDMNNNDFRIDILNSRLEHKNNEIKDLKQDFLDTLKRIIDIGEANHYNNSQTATRKMKEIAEEHYKRIAIDLYDLNLPMQNNRTTTTDQSK